MPRILQPEISAPRSGMGLLDPREVGLGTGGVGVIAALRRHHRRLVIGRPARRYRGSTNGDARRSRGAGIGGAPIIAAAAIKVGGATPPINVGGAATIGA